MFIYSVKASTLKFAALLLLSVVALSMAAFLLPDGAVVAVGNTALTKKDFEGVDSAEARLDFLKLCGWETETEAVSVRDVTIPAVFDSVYASYNLLQSDLGLDLSDYKNKTVKQYTYVVTNYDYDGTVYANLLIYDGCVIGGDVASARADGFMKSLVKGA